MAQKQKQYLVKWEIDISASSPEEAAKEALEIQRDKKSEALVFDVYEQASNSQYQIDLYNDTDNVKDPVTRAVTRLAELEEAISLNVDVDWDTANPSTEFKLMRKWVKKIQKDLESTI